MVTASNLDNKKETFTIGGKGLANNMIVANKAGEDDSRNDDFTVTCYSPLETY